MSVGGIALAVVSIEITKILFLEVRTFHTRFKAPLNMKSTDVYVRCYI